MEKSKPKILFITGLHGDEQYAEFLLKEYLKDYNEETSPFTYYKHEFVNTQNKREVSFNLNRLDEVQSLIEYSNKMQKLLDTIDLFDIVIDIHNSPVCANLMLMSSPDDKKQSQLVPYRFKQRIDKRNSLVWRKSKTTTISEHCRNQDKISFTFEFNGMYCLDDKNNDKLENDKYDLELMINDALYLHEVKVAIPTDEIYNLPYTPLYTIENELCLIKLNKRKFLTPDYLWLEGDETFTNILKSITRSDGTKLESFKDIVEIVVLSPDGNYTDTFEGIIKFARDVNKS